MKETGRSLQKYRGTECLNCGVPLDIIDKYCHRCGQLNTTKKLSFFDFFGEFFASLFSYDSRLSHTMTAMLFKPGKISKDYVNGKRSTYVNPFRFFLSISVLFFIINGLFIDFDTISSKLNKNINTTEFKEITNSFKSNLNEDVENKGQKKLASPDSAVFNIKVRDSSKNIVKNNPHTEKQLDSMSFIDEMTSRWDIYTEYYDKTHEISAKIALDSLQHDQSWFNRYVYKRSIKTSHINESPMEPFKYVFNKLPFIIFFFLPFFAMAIWLIYARRPYTYMEHLVFAFHTQTVFFIVLGISILIDKIGANGTAITIAFLLFLVYLYIAMLKFYGQGKMKTFIKFLLLNFLFLNLALIGISLAFAGSILIF